MRRHTDTGNKEIGRYFGIGYTGCKPGGIEIKEGNGRGQEAEEDCAGT